MQEQLIKLPIQKESFLALWKCWPNENILSKNILLTHGTFSNRKVLKGVVQYLVSNGYTCWVFEWRSHGSSSKVKEKFNFESIALDDFYLVFNYLINDCKIKRLDCVMHSGGGICLTMFLINRPKFKENINSITMLACQAYDAASSKLKYTRILISKYISFLLGMVPAEAVGGVEKETYYMMKQWFDWNLTSSFTGLNNIDYKEKMKSIGIPTLAIFAAGDKFIAPAEACQSFNDAFENPLNKTMLCSRDNGFIEDYNHSRIVHSSSAAKEVYPKILDWINNQSF